jgi:hypothetical protein
MGSSVNLAACHHPAWTPLCSLTNETIWGHGVQFGTSERDLEGWKQVHGVVGMGVLRKGVCD